MNQISQLRQDVQKHGVCVISIDDYNELQREWITRAKIDFDGDYIPREKIHALLVLCQVSLQKAEQYQDLKAYANMQGRVQAIELILNFGND